MFGWKKSCDQYQARMEDSIGAPAPGSDPELATHLTECESCRDAFAAAELSGRLLSSVEAYAGQPSEAFVTRVMASIRETEAMLSSPAAVWQPLEALASRFALVSAVVLLALSVFLGEFSPALRQAEVVSTVPAATEITNEWPEPPVQPATQDEVLMSLVDINNGI